MGSIKLGACRFMRLQLWSHPLLMCVDANSSKYCKANTKPPWCSAKARSIAPGSVVPSPERISQPYGDPPLMDSMMD
uniref:Uncharacterized protein n=1 Tax=Salix viminalis TaxID=40686 RepID=A0A6N2L5V7_SALVM